MTRTLLVAAALTGAAVISWMGAGFIGASPLALLITLVIGGVYLAGLAELVYYRRATAGLDAALDGLTSAAPEDPAALENWLIRLHPSLQNAVRQRVTGGSAGLPAPVFTPYLVGLLVMLGLIGTFAGMVETLQGAVIALQGNSDLQTIRDGLAAPIAGLGMAFGTSVAGVAGSAMLGLVSTLCRRERMLATRALDRATATVLRLFTPAHQREETFNTLREQAAAMPRVAGQLQAVAQHLERMGETLGDRLAANQAQFHDSAGAAYNELAVSVEKSLRDTLGESARLAGDGIRPVVLDAMEGLSREAREVQQQLAASAGEQLAALGDRLEQASASWTSAHAAQMEQLAQVTSAELSSLREDEARRGVEAAQRQQTLHTAAAEQLHQLLESTGVRLASLREDENRRGEAALQQLQALQSTAADSLQQLGRELEQPLAHLMESAAEAPRAAADVLNKLREEVAAGTERDNALLDERRQLMLRLDAVAERMAESSGRQREALEQMVSRSAGVLDSLSTDFSAHLGAEVGRISAAADNVSLSAAEIASQGEAFSLAVDLFNRANTGLIDTLASIGQAMEQSASRSDEQLGYYVAQAREVIDHSMLSQREIIQQLRELGERGPAEPARAEAG